MKRLEKDNKAGAQAVMMFNAIKGHNKSLDDQRYISRIIQYQGKRRNIRLEALFWNILEEMAREKSCKLNFLVNELISEDKAEKNHTAYLRYRAVSWLNRRLYSASEKLFLQNTEVRAILNATGLPGFIFSSTNMLSRFNTAFHDWLVMNIEELDFELNLSKIRVSFRRSFAAITNDLKNGNGLLDNEHCAILLHYSAKGRVYMGLFNL